MQYQNNNPLVGFAELLKRIAMQLPPPPWQQESQQEPSFLGLEEEPPPAPEAPKKIGQRGML